MRRAFAWLSVLAFSWVAPAAMATVVLNVDPAGVLLGAKGVDVGGVLYNVEFKDGTCADLYNGCNAASDFPFDNLTALVAGQALLDQVLLDGPQGNFDSNPALTQGCTTSTQGLCQLRTPIPGPSSLLTTPSSVTRVAAFNFGSGQSNTDDVGLDCCGSDTSSNASATYVIWTLASTESNVPEPGSLALVAGATLAAGAAGRKRRRPPPSKGTSPEPARTRG